MTIFKNIFLPCCLVFSVLISMQNCAVQIPPTGGPKDTLAPILTSSTIKDSAINFNGKSLNFKFNEYLETADLAAKLVINPLPIKTPTINSRLNSFTINLKDSLLPNTTYTVSILGGIKDLNEGNAIPQFKYLFSTGSTIATGSISGTVYNAATGQPDSTLIVMLHTNPHDSVVITKNPKYITQCKSNGSFTLPNLANDVYYIYALETDLGNYTYNNIDKKFAFANNPITINNNQQNQTLQAFIVEKIKDNNAPKINAPKPTKETDKRLKISLNLNNNQQNLLTPLTIETSKPIKNINQSFIQLIANKKTVPFTLVKDTATNNKFNIVTPWLENTNYALLLQKEFITDTLNNNYYKALDTLTFTTQKNADYGSLEIDFKNLNAPNALLQILSSNEVKESITLQGNKFFKKLMEPGTYQIRIVQDDNKNKKWDTGNFFKGKLQPEKVIFIKDIINVKANFDKQYTVVL